jgi:nitrogen fixation/metabolism regulation signal transduction histidine kinase
MAIRTVKLPINLFIFALFGLILLSLQLMSSATQEFSHLNEMYSQLLLINGVGSLILLGLVGGNVYSLIRYTRKKEAGSRLTVRMVSLFVVLALAPATLVFYFSVQFLHKNIDSWFNVEIDRAMEDALELSQASLEQRMRWHLAQTEALSHSLQDLPENQATVELDFIRESSGALEMALFSSQEHIIAFSSINPADIVPKQPDDHVWMQLKQDQSYIALDTLSDDSMVIRVVIIIHEVEPKYLQVLYKVPVRIADLADSIEFAALRYKEMRFLRDSLKISFSLALSLVLLLSLLAAIWVAFISIRNIVAPVKELVKGTKAVAAGDYAQQLPVMTQDDLGFLVESFNQMTRRIAESRDEAKLASVEVEEQRSYLESILANVTAGVMSFEADFTIRTTNQAAYRILHCQDSYFVGKSLPQLAFEFPALADLFNSMQGLIEQAEDIWQQRVAFLGASGRQELLCRGTPLFSQEREHGGAVVVFDDLTDLIQAQKNAAWGEVARRLAHEIKNPLTPIQLAAERLQHRLAKELEPASADILQRSTRTIVQQVEAMKRMVDDFAEYARPSKKQVAHLNLQDLVQDLLLLYNNSPTQINFISDFTDNAVMVYADPVSMRQVLHNLLKNAQEAMESGGLIEIKLSQVQKNNADYVELGIYDHGSGINAEQIEKIFDPYMTTKPRGTGLGLAIVKKIIEEHGGLIWIDSSYTQGAGFIMQLPLAVGAN